MGIAQQNRGNRAISAQAAAQSSAAVTRMGRPAPSQASAVAPAAAPVFTKGIALRWMRAAVRDSGDYRERITGEINMTALAEACAAHFDQNHTGGPLDDPDHFIWEAACDVKEADDGSRS